MIAVIAVTCTVVWPVHNFGWDHGRAVRYKDRGDHIVYSRKVSPRFRRLVETMKGTEKRGGCS
jgi:hypothetical protein